MRVISNLDRVIQEAPQLVLFSPGGILNASFDATEGLEPFADDSDCLVVFFFFKEHPPLPNMQVDVTSSQIPARVVFQPPSPMIRLDAADPIETLCGPVWGSSTARKRDQRRDLRMVVGQSHHNRISLRQIIDLHSCAFMFMLNSTSIPMLVA